MRITFAYNLRTELSEAQAELLSQEDVDRIGKALTDLKHKVTRVEVSGSPERFIAELIASEPDLVFNVAEGHVGSSREAFYPGLYEQLGLPFTGGDASLLHMNLDKNLSKTVLSQRGVNVPKGFYVTRPNQPIPKNVNYPLIIKPNSEGSSKGITRDSVVETAEACRKQIDKMIALFPAGLVVEEFIAGRELTIPYLQAFPGQLMEVVEHTFDMGKLGGKYNIYDYDMKQGGQSAEAVGVRCPAPLTTEEREAVYELARHVFEVMPCPDFGRVDVRMNERGEPYFIELNPLPSLHPNASLMTAGRHAGLDFKEVMRLIIRSAAKRYNIPLRRPRAIDITKVQQDGQQRPTARELGIRVGRFDTGRNNAITDVKGVRVGHVTTIKDNVVTHGVAGSSCIRTGVTAIVPASGDVFHRRLVAGGFVLNGVGEMSGLTQAMEWGWLESPILLTNSLSVGRVHAGVVNHFMRQYPELGKHTDVMLPIVGECDDSWLNDARIGLNASQDASRAIEAATPGPVAQGSVGAGTGMTTFDFAGGIGTSSRVVSTSQGHYTLGVLVMSNFGLMPNLTVDGRVVGRKLDPLFDVERRTNSYGSVIAVIATDAPLLSSQLSRVAKRAALGLGRVGSHAASTSGEILIAFSAANRLPRVPEKAGKLLSVDFIPDQGINGLYEGVIEATEEAVLNAIFCSNGMTGRSGRVCPALPQDRVLEFLSQGTIANVSNQ
ncbi:MAG: P1 family peptidase [Sumerlaeia bacterium]